MDPSQQSSGYPLERVPVPTRPPAMPAAPEPIRPPCSPTRHTLDRIMAGYHILDRNYTYDFHNYLFMRTRRCCRTIASSRLQKVEEARRLRDAADAEAAIARPTLASDDPLAALLDDLRGYVAFIFDRAPTLERMSGEFERTPSGLQHAAHLYEGENKFLGARLEEILAKHHTVVESPAVAPVVGDFASASRSIRDAYAHHVVGF